MLDNHFPPKDGFWQRVWSALQPLIALVIFAIAHWIVNHVLKWILPPNLEWAFPFVEDVFYVFFFLVYVYLGWEMVTVFIPWLRRGD